MYWHKIAVAVLWLGLIHSSFAQAIDLDMIGVRSFALGNAVTAYSDSIESVYKNPAILGGLDHAVVYSSYSSVYDSSFSTLSFQFGTPVFKNISLGLSIPYRSIQGIAQTQDDGTGQGEQIGSFSDDTTAGVITIGSEIMNILQVGMNINGYQRSVFGKKASSIGIDIGTLITIFDYKIGVSAINIGDRTIAWKDGTNDIIKQSVNIGVSIPWFKSHFLADGMWMENKDFEVNLGNIFHLTDTVAVEAGWQNLKTQDWHLGVSVFLRAFSIDYAYANNVSLGSIHKVAFTYAF